jgi:hypothetical protein
MWEIPEADLQQEIRPGVLEKCLTWISKSEIITSREYIQYYSIRTRWKPSHHVVVKQNQSLIHVIALTIIMPYKLSLKVKFV